MHIVMFLDQHPDTLGGAQLSVVLQAKFLRKAGHTVTLCAPASRSGEDREHVITFPSIALGKNGGYGLSRPSTKIQTELDAKFNDLPPIDVVHIQADFWGAIIGLEFARRHDLPTVMTFHNNVTVGTQYVLGPLLGKLFIMKIAGWLRGRLHLQNTKLTNDGWQYLATIGSVVDLRLAPTAHFARELEGHGTEEVSVLSNGLDDDSMRHVARKVYIVAARPKLVWTGRLSKEKRLLPFLEAVKQAELQADVEIYGSGSLETAAKKFIEDNDLTNTVHFKGSVSSDAMLQALADADVLVQTSIGFETQGRTVFEALTFGTPVILSDPAIAEDFEADQYWLVDDDSTEALTATLKRAVSDIQAGVGKHIDQSAGNRFLQSNLTQQALDAYETARRHHLASVARPDDAKRSV